MLGRSKTVSIAGVALAGALALYGATQIWLTVELTAGAAAFTQIEITGQQLNQSLSPIALAALAAALALTIAGKVFRSILGAVVLLLGTGIIAIAIAVMAEPGASASGRISEATGIAGAQQLQLIAEVHTSFVVWVTAIAGALLVLFGLFVLIASGRWKQAGRKYDAAASGESRKVGNEMTAEPDRISDWESMNDGVDPSDDPREDSSGMPGSR